MVLVHRKWFGGGEANSHKQVEQAGGIDGQMGLFFLSEVQYTFLCALVSLVSLEAQHTERSDYRTGRKKRKYRVKERTERQSESKKCYIECQRQKKRESQI